MYFLIINFLTPKPQELDYFKFIERYDEESRASRREVEVLLEGDSAVMYNKNVAVYKTDIVSREDFKADIQSRYQELKNDGIEPIPLDIVPVANNSLIPTIISFITTVVFIVLLFIILRQMMGLGKSGTMNFGKSRARTNENVKVRLRTSRAPRRKRKS